MVTVNVPMRERRESPPVALCRYTHYACNYELFKKPFH